MVLREVKRLTNIFKYNIINLKNFYKFKDYMNKNKTSQKGIDLIKHFEGLHDGDLHTIGLQPKLCPAGIWTVGYGRALRDDSGEFLTSKFSYDSIRFLRPEMFNITIDQAEEFLREDLIKFEKIVLSKLNVSLKQHEFDALVSHTYNTGGSSNLFKLVNEKNKKKIKDWWLSTYITANKVKLKGLVKRRNAEWELFDKGILKFN